MKKTKNTKGITLIALVITIIVLLILAGITIAALTGENGLLSRAREAKTEWEKSAADEEEALDSINWEDLTGIENEVIITKATGDGNLSEGDGSENNPYKIQSIEDLVTLSNNVKNGQLYENMVISLERNLDFQNSDSYIDATRKDFGDVNGNGTAEELKTELTTGKGFQPIGTGDSVEGGYSYFKGTLAGGKKAIVNLYENRSSTSGLFGYITGSTIKDLYLKDVNIVSTGSYTAGLVAILQTKAQISNVKTSGTIQGSGYTGGIVGNSVSYSSENEEVTFTNCTNKANIIASSWGAGGIVGHFIKVKAIIKNSSNNGNITGLNALGGLIGASETETIIRDSFNTGTINSTSDCVGGIIGQHSYKGNIEITNCHNTGDVTGYNGQSSGDSVGGILGQDTTEKITLRGCHNKGKILSRGNTGGLIGYQQKENGMCEIYNSYNEGKIESKDNGYTGGLVAHTKGNVIIDKCYNLGYISSESGYGYVGGILGYQEAYLNRELDNKITNCYNNGEITVKGTRCGGILGNGCCNINNCFNNKKIKYEGNYGSYTGGIAGQLYDSEGDISISNCYNIGEIIGGTDDVGGVAGQISAKNISVSNCYNVGTTTSTRNYSIGALLGIFYGSKSSTFLNNYYLNGVASNPISGKDDVAGQYEKVQTVEEMKTIMNTNLVNAGGWKANENNGYPALDF